MTDELRSGGDEQAQNLDALSAEQDLLVSEIGGLSNIGDISGNEAAQQEHLVALAHEAEADESASKRWDEPAEASTETPEQEAHRQLSKDEKALHELNAAIDAHPEGAVNYVFRGELLFKLKEYAAAEADFQRALEMASDQVAKSRWGIVAQTVQDRAYAGLRDARQKQGF
ncbi:MAG: hypothetical protein UZ15_CFX003003267 [Chloroflexi bacterium OLB15]|nr:MAG: hypothetical protein UZ15_CFX003003267 [Chloroflexi bacterium OLB15]